MVAVAPAGALTTMVTAGDVDVLKAVALVGVNTAVSECDPGPNVEMDPLAMPLVTGTRSPRLVVPSLNCTLPAAAGVTVAVSVTAAFWATGESGDAVNVVVVVVAAARASACGVSTGGAELATPLMSNDAATTATGTMQTPAACQGITLLLGMMGFTSIPVAWWTQDSVSGSPASSAFERARDQIVTMKDVAAGAGNDNLSRATRCPLANTP